MSSLVLYQVIVICILESQFQVSTADNNFLTGKKYFKILSFIFIMYDVTFWNGKIRQYEYMYEYPFQKFLICWGFILLVRFSVNLSIPKNSSNSINHTENYIIIYSQELMILLL